MKNKIIFVYIFCIVIMFWIFITPSKAYTNLDEIEKYIEDHEQNMIVTSTDIDMIIKEFSDIIAEGINKTLHPCIYS